MGKMKYDGFLNREAFEQSEKILALSSERLSMLGICNHSFDNGTKLVRLYADGLVQYGYDWSLNMFEEEELTQNEIYASRNYTIRIQNLPDDTPNKEMLEKTNFNIMIKHPFGLVELIRRTPRLHESEINKCMDVVEYRNILFNRRGYIVFDNVSHLNNKGCCFFGSLDYVTKLGEMREKVMKAIIEQGVTQQELESLCESPLKNGIFEYTQDRVYGMTVYGYMYEMNKLLGIHVIHTGMDTIKQTELTKESGEYVVYLGGMNEHNNALAVFDGSGELKEFGYNTPIISDLALLDVVRNNSRLKHYMQNKMIAIVEDGIISIDPIKCGYTKIKMEVPKTEFSSVALNNNSVIIKSNRVELFTLSNLAEVLKA